MGASEETMFPNDIFGPHRFNDQEREYLLRHLGETPRIALGKEKVKRPANEAGLRIALQRVFEEKDDATMMASFRKGLELALELDIRKREESRRHGSIDYAAMGVGCGPGQTSREQHFDTNMSPKLARSGVDLIKDLRQEFAGEEVSDAPARGISSLPCAWCEDGWDGPGALASLQMHVMKSHRPHWEQFKGTIGPALRKGDIGPLMEAAEVHEAEGEEEAETPEIEDLPESVDEPEETDSE